MKSAVVAAATSCLTGPVAIPQTANMTPRRILSQLDVNERAALVALTKAVILSDGKVSEDEQEEVAKLSAALGQDHYRALLDVMDTRLPDEDGLKRFLLTVTRQDARELIYAIVLEAAAAGGVGGDEPQLLSWLEHTWDLKVRVDPPGDRSGDGGPT